MELSNIYEIWDRFEKSDIAEFELDMDNVHLALKKQTANVPGVAPVATAVTQSASETAPAVLDKKEEKTDANNAICAPLVGTFFVAASPDSKPYVQVGDAVKKGDVIGIIEAMKLMNEVKADKDGIVANIPVEDGSMVEYGQVLIELK